MLGSVPSEAAATASRKRAWLRRCFLPVNAHVPPSPSSSTVVIYSIVIVRTQLRLRPLADQKDEKEKSFINATEVIGSQTPLLVYISEYLPSRLNPQFSEVYSLPSMSRCTYDNNLSRIYVHIPSLSITGKAIKCPHRYVARVDCSLPMSLPLLLDIDIDTSGIDDRLWQVCTTCISRT